MSVYFHIQIRANNATHSEQLSEEHVGDKADAVIPGDVYQGLHWSMSLANAWGCMPDVSEGIVFKSSDFTSRSSFRSHVARLIQCTYEAVDDSVTASGYGGWRHLEKGAALLAAVQAITADMWDTHEISVQWY